MTYYQTYIIHFTKGHVLRTKACECAFVHVVAAVRNALSTTVTSKTCILLRCTFLLILTLFKFM